MKQIIKELLSLLKICGFKGQIVSIDHLPQMREEIEKLHKEGKFCHEFYQERLTFFDYKPPEDLKEAKSIIVVAAPQPKIQVTFNWKKNPLSLIIPPTYSYQTDEEIKNLLIKLLKPKGYHFARALLPLKALAIHSGLAKYGRNNITYVNEMGSFHRLVAFYSDLPFSQDNWQDFQMMKRCQKCSACLKNCPTEALTPKRFLLRAERCLTFHNERKASFPTWIDPSWHNCLIGCMYCQTVCPENKNFVNWTGQGEEFNEEETTFMLKETPAENLPRSAVEKLERLYLIDELEILPRNLRPFL